VRDRLNLTERTKMLLMLHRTYRPLGVGYEKYGKDSDIQHIETEMERQNYRFTITPLGGQIAKPERIKRLVPIFEQGRMFLPLRGIARVDHEGHTHDLVRLVRRAGILGVPGLRPRRHARLHVAHPRRRHGRDLPRARGREGPEVDARHGRRSQHDFMTS
jgi:hypothetical protein